MAFSSESSNRKVLYSSVRCMLVWKLINYEQKICPETVSSTLLENEGSSGFPNTRKLVKARGRRPSIRAFIVFEYSRLRNKRNWKYSRIFSHVTNQSYVVIQTKKWVHLSLMLYQTQGFDILWNSWIARHSSVSPVFQTTCMWRNWRVLVGWSPYE